MSATVQSFPTPKLVEAVTVVNEPAPNITSPAVPVNVSEVFVASAINVNLAADSSYLPKYQHHFLR